MIIILSAQYVVESVRAEVGELPVSFIPLANRRIYAYQVEALRRKFSGRPILLTLPGSFIVSEAELKWLNYSKVDLLMLNNVSNIGEELTKVLQSAHLLESPCLFLDGTCLPMEIPDAPDSIGVFETDLEPLLPIESYGRERDLVWAGIFSVSNLQLLSDCLNEEISDYYRAVKRYSFNISMQNFKIDKCFNFSNATGYFHARASFTTERAFNFLKIENTVLKKFSSNHNKLLSEAYWFDNIPANISKYVPKYFGDGIDNSEYFYSIEYLGAIPLSESFVYGRHTVVFWERVLTKISSFLNEARCKQDYKIPIGATKEALFVRKARSRLAEFVKQTDFDVELTLEINGILVPSLRQVLEDASAQLLSLNEVPAFIHGDLCLSNILYDSRMRSIKLIDPRGIDEDGEKMLFGSQIYDIAKLAHSILGLYDHIIAGQFEMSVEGGVFSFRIFVADDIEEIQNAFRNHSIMFGMQPDLIEKILPLLFISMLPLHADSKWRQLALLANAIRIHAETHGKGLN
jgi:hypothetical protein